MNPREEEKNQLSEMCDQLGLSEEEKDAAMAFFSGEAGEEALTKIRFRDLSGTSSDALEMIMYELTRKEKTAELGKLFLLLFAAGQSTCWRLLREKTYIRKKFISDVDPAKAAAVYGAELGMSAYYLSAYSLVELMELMDDTPGTIQQMLNYEKSGTEDGRLVLLAAYFQKKYRCDGQPQTVKEEDRKLLEEYETALVECLCRFYAGAVEPEALKELSECILNGGRPQQFLSSTGIAQAPGRQFRLAVGVAYLNYPLSDRLKNIVRICMEVNWEETLDNAHSISSKFPMALNKVGGDYDRVFGIDSTEYIRWAMKKSMDHILGEQAVSNPESYLHILDEADTGNANRMLWYIKPGNPALYAKMVEEKKEEYKERVIAELIRKEPDGEVMKTYLRGEGTAEVLYPYFGATTTNRYYDGGREYVLLSDFHRNFEDEEFYRRCEVYMLSRHANIFFRNQVTASDGKETHLDKESVKKLFMDFTEEGAALCYQMLAVSALHESMYAGMEQDLLDGLAGYFSGCLKERRQETLEVFAGADAYGRFVGLNMLVREAEQNKEEILKYSQDSSEIVKEELFGFLCAQKSWEEDVKKLLASKKAAQREFAVRVLLCWQKDGADYRELFAQAMEREKSAKVRELLGNALSKNGEEESDRQAVSREELVKSLHRGGRKRSLAWAYETPFPAVRMADGSAVKETGEQEAKSGSAGDAVKKDAQETAADEEYLQAILLCYVSSDAAAAKEGIASKEANASADGCGVSRNAEFLAEVLNAGDLAVYMNELFDRWLAAGAEVKKRWVLYAAAIHGGSEIVEKLERKIR
ncbi:MAG: hypothetical protein K2N94_10385, partial [Lachnospiraceae bacterium]|nr:hypothetical protein [Lachnospiraceae bacterium]